MDGVIIASEPSWIGPFTGLSPRCFGKLVIAIRRETVADMHRGRPWSLPLEDRILLVAAYWRANSTMRQLAPLFGVYAPWLYRRQVTDAASCRLTVRRPYRKVSRSTCSANVFFMHTVWSQKKRRTSRTIAVS